MGRLKLLEGSLKLIEGKLKPMQVTANKLKTGFVAGLVTWRGRRTFHPEANKGFSLTAYNLAVRARSLLGCSPSC